jgi:hypothetical protein
MWELMAAALDRKATHLKPKINAEPAADAEPACSVVGARVR